MREADCRRTTARRAAADGTAPGRTAAREAAPRWTTTGRPGWRAHDAPPAPGCARQRRSGRRHNGPRDARPPTMASPVYAGAGCRPVRPGRTILSRTAKRRMNGTIPGPPRPVRRLPGGRSPRHQSPSRSAAAPLLGPQASSAAMMMSAQRLSDTATIKASARRCDQRPWIAGGARSSREPIPGPAAGRSPGHPAGEPSPGGHVPGQGTDGDAPDGGTPDGIGDRVARSVIGHATPAGGGAGPVLRTSAARPQDNHAVPPGDNNPVVSFLGQWGRQAGPRRARLPRSRGGGAGPTQKEALGTDRSEAKAPFGQAVTPLSVLLPGKSEDRLRLMRSFG